MPPIELTKTRTLFAPAKLNLGLEVIGLYPDGYHEVVTILQAVSLYDQIELIPAPSLQYASTAQIPQDADLAYRALTVADRELGITLRAEVRLTKAIPMAAGLGGGSSDAGTLLGALGVLAGIPTSEVAVAAAQLGADVPFFVHGGTALATATGTAIEPLPPMQRQWFVVVIPQIEIPNKTATLYGELTRADFSDGQATREQAERIRRGQAIDSALLRNAFARPLQQWRAVGRAVDIRQTIGSRRVLPSGAGPAIYAVFETYSDAAAAAAQLPRDCGEVLLCTNVGPDLNASRITT